MIYFDVTERDGDRELRIEGTDVLVGWIEQGRVLQTRSGRRVEWGFIPNTSDPAVRFPVHTNGIAGAYEDAREFAATIAR